MNVAETLLDSEQLRAIIIDEEDETQLLRNPKYANPHRAPAAGLPWRTLTEERRPRLDRIVDNLGQLRGFGTLCLFGRSVNALVVLLLAVFHCYLGLLARIERVKGMGSPSMRHPPSVLFFMNGNMPKQQTGCS